MLFYAEMATGPPSSFPIFVTIAACIGIIGPAIIGVFVQFRAATLKTNQDQLREAMKGCQEQAARDKAELRDEIQKAQAEIRELQDRLRESEKRESVWQTRYEVLIAKSRDFPSTPPKSEPK